MGKINRDILKDYSKYESLLKERKHTLVRTISFCKTKLNRKDILYFESKLNHTSIDEELKLILEVKTSNSKDFKFKLRCTALSQEPFFRFDSYGAAHKNNNPDIPLHEQIVTTPHFNAFDNKGKAIAYKTSQLKSPTESKALEDINLCFTHFCFETNTRYPEDDFTQISLEKEGQLNLVSNSEDILSNINFGV